jgi:hypothetical protein
MYVISVTFSLTIVFTLMHDSFIVVRTCNPRWEAREYFHLPKVTSQTSGGKEVSYISILDWLQAESSRCPKHDVTSMTS